MTVTHIKNVIAVKTNFFRTWSEERWKKNEIKQTRTNTTFRWNLAENTSSTIISIMKNASDSLRHYDKLKVTPSVANCAKF